MSIDIIKQRLKDYDAQSKQEEINALKEIYQEIALAGLSRGEFFKIAAFQGGTCLRIIHGLKRFSEDLDFILLSSQSSFKWQHFLKAIELEFQSFGLELKVKERDKAEGAIRTAFLKENSFGKILELKHSRLPSDQQVIKIKLEIDVSPPEGSTFETHFLTYPYPFSILSQDLPCLFASKCHALLCRSYIKGRDWFDFLWYLSKNIPINTSHLKIALNQAGPFKGTLTEINQNWLTNEFEKKILSIDWNIARQDVEVFLAKEDRRYVSHWCKELFQAQLSKLQFKTTS